MKGFIPSSLDDAGLSPSEFRVYCHLLRSADNDTGVAWPSYKRMTEITGMGKTTIRRAIEELERREAVRKIGKPFAGSCRYQVFPIVPPEGQKETPNSSTGGTIEAPPIVPSQTRNSSVSGSPIVPPEGQEGNPKKVIQLRESKGDDLPFSSDQFQEAWNDWKQHRIEIKKKLTPLTTSQQLKKLSEMGEERAIAAIYHTIEKGWQGIFEPGTQNAPTGGKTTLERLMGGRTVTITKTKTPLEKLMGGRTVKISKAPIEET